MPERCRGDGDVDVDRDRALVEEFQGGDEAAFDDLYRRYHARLYRFCLRRLEDPNDAEEVTQESFVRAWRNLGKFNGERRFYPWLTVIASNLCVDVIRRRARTTPVAQPDPAPVSGGQEESVCRAADLDALDKALARLSAKNRDALRMREHAGWSYENIAQQSGLTVPAVESLLWRARQALRREFAAVTGEEGLLSTVPIMGWLIRRAARAQRRIYGWVANPELSPSMGTAVAALAMGSMLTLPGALSAPSHQNLAAPQSTATLDSSAPATAAALAPVGAAPATPANTVAAPAPSADQGSSSSANGRLMQQDPNTPIVSPKILTYGDEQKQASSQPVYVDAGGLANAGADPDAAATRADEIVQSVSVGLAPRVKALQESVK